MKNIYETHIAPAGDSMAPLKLFGNPAQLLETLESSVPDETWLDFLKKIALKNEVYETMEGENV